MQTTDSIPSEIAAQAREVATEAAWHQWSLLGASTGVAPSETTLLDPEALVLASLALRSHERRLSDMLTWWAATGSALLSVQRMRTLATRFPDAPDGSSADGLAVFAASAFDAGDRRWRRHAADTRLDGRPGKGSETPALYHPATLVLRLRAGFGVSAKADLLAILLGHAGHPLPVKALAQVSGYSTVAVRAAVDDMVLASFAERTDAYPSAYLARSPMQWSQLLGGTDSTVLPWGYWSAIYVFLLEVDAWGRAASEHGWSAYVAGSRARDLLERHRPITGVLSRLGISTDSPSDKDPVHRIAQIVDNVACKRSRKG